MKFSIFKTYRKLITKLEDGFMYCKYNLTPDLVLDTLLNWLFDVFFNAVCRHTMFALLFIVFKVIIPIILIAIALAVVNAEPLQKIMMLDGDIVFIYYYLFFIAKIAKYIYAPYHKAKKFIYTANFREIFNKDNSKPLIIFNFITFFISMYLLWVNNEDSADFDLVLMLFFFFLFLIGLFFTEMKEASQVIMVSICLLIAGINNIYANPEKFPDSPLLKYEQTTTAEQLNPTSYDKYGGKFVYPTLSNCSSYAQCYGIDNYSTLEYNQNNTLQNNGLTKVIVIDDIAFKMAAKSGAKALSATATATSKAIAKSAAKIAKVAAKPILRALKPSKSRLAVVVNKKLTSFKSAVKSNFAKRQANFAKTKSRVVKNTTLMKARFKNVVNSTTQTFKKAKDKLLTLGKKAKSWYNTVVKNNNVLNPKKAAMVTGTAQGVSAGSLNTQRLNYFQQQSKQWQEHFKGLSKEAKLEQELADKQAKQLTKQTLDIKARNEFTTSRNARTSDISKADHFQKHKNEFLTKNGELMYKTEQDYVNGALKLLNNPSKNVLTIRRTETITGANNGDIVRYNQKTNELAIMTHDGKIRSYFRPFPRNETLNPDGYKIGEYSNGKEYFYSQR